MTEKEATMLCPVPTDTPNFKGQKIGGVRLFTAKDKDGNYYMAIQNSDVRFYDFARAQAFQNTLVRHIHEEG